MFFYDSVVLFVLWPSLMMFVCFFFRCVSHSHGDVGRVKLTCFLKGGRSASCSDMAKFCEYDISYFYLINMKSEKHEGAGNYDSTTGWYCLSKDPNMSLL
ncbi:Hypothetical predicted protein [Xyrichtys novacula]|uniref:Secreted protein n=1 Tax=Xyrichtys novacula TaxID=13765 RepID=A0AAV1G2E7_XYRNO|nr:Hypothetical predicted protein [Xyrichtys novacula]